MIFRKSFTLIELLVVVAIIGVLSSVIFVGLREVRGRARDARRVSEIDQIVKALELYLASHDTLPRAYQYGEGNVSPGWWNTWWDLSSADADGDGNYFLDFLVEGNTVPSVPLDPLNTPEDFNGAPQADGYRYFYFIAPTNYVYQGGSCVYGEASVYMIGVANFESSRSRELSPGCECLWRDRPGFFDNTFDYVVCGAF